MKNRIRTIESDARARQTASELEVKRLSDETTLLKEQVLNIKREHAVQLQSLQTQVRTLESANQALSNSAGVRLRSSPSRPTGLWL